MTSRVRGSRSSEARVIRPACSRWARYTLPFRDNRMSTVTPPPGGSSVPWCSRVTGVPRRSPLPRRRFPGVETIKINRAKRNLDTIRCNRDKLVYECVWCLSSDERTWFCMFAIDIYGWKSLGNSIVQPAHGCAGFYALPDGHAPPNATTGVTSAIIVPNLDELDPFGR